MSFVSSVLGLYACWVRQDVIARIKLGVIAMEWDWGRDILFAPCVLVSVIQVITAAQVSGHWGNWVGNRSCSRSMNSEQSEFPTSKVISSRLREKNQKTKNRVRQCLSSVSLSWTRGCSVELGQCPYPRKFLFGIMWPLFCYHKGYLKQFPSLEDFNLGSALRMYRLAVSVAVSCFSALGLLAVTCGDTLQVCLPRPDFP